MSRLLLATFLFALTSLFEPPATFAQPPDACELSLTPPKFEPASQDELHALPHSRASGHTAFHGQGLYGLNHLYLSHLAVFMGATENHPHNFQVILEVDLDDEEDQRRYRADKSQNATSLYTVTPTPFDQTALVADYAGRPALRRLPATSIVRGHFEQGGKEILGNVNFDIASVVYFREFFLGGKKLADQNYLLFGRGGEAFAAHLLSAPPDFDQTLTVEVEIQGSPGEAVVSDFAKALGRGIYMRLPGRSNRQATRLHPGSELTCGLLLAPGSDQIKVTVRTRDEIYCEAGEFSQLVIKSFNQQRRCAVP